MKVFISWSGEESHAVAQVLRTQLPCIINAVKPFVSSEDVEKGSAWFQHIATELEKSEFGILCVTAKNQNSKWVQFEAGALAGRFSKARVAPLLVETQPTAITPPLSQFQLTELNNKEDFYKLLCSINALLGEQALQEETLKESYEIWWDAFCQKVKVALDKVPKSQNKRAIRTEKEILEEILGIVRSLSINDPFAELLRIQALQGTVVPPMNPAPEFAPPPLAPKGPAVLNPAVRYRSSSAVITDDTVR